MGNVVYDQTYWNSKGKYEGLIRQLQARVPISGPVQNADNNPKLDLFRRASGCYYDLYNNGLGNRFDEFPEVFGFEVHPFSETITQEIVDRTETAMDAIILAAYAEQFAAHHVAALHSIATLWPLDTTAKISEVNGINDGRSRAIIAEYAVNIAREALGLAKAL